jgi:hypothetical protein
MYSNDFKFWKKNNSILISIGKKYTDLEIKWQVKISAFNRVNRQKRSGIQDVFVLYGQYFSCNKSVLIKNKDMEKSSLSINWLMYALGRKQTYMNCNENYKTFQKYHLFEPLRNFIKLILPSIYSLSSSETEQFPPYSPTVFLHS